MVRTAEWGLLLALIVALVILTGAALGRWDSATTRGLHTILFIVFVWLTWRAIANKSAIAGLWIAFAVVFAPFTFTHMGAERWDERTWSLLELSTIEWQLVSAAAAVAITLQAVAVLRRGNSVR